MMKQRRSGSGFIFAATAFLAGICLLGQPGTWAQAQAESPQPLNVLFISIDDLRDPGGPDSNWVLTPQIDRLAEEGRWFQRHYVYIAACGPSRSTLLSGKRQFDWDYLAPLRQQKRRNPQMAEPEQPVSLAHLFRRAGYRTISIGKISHQPGGCVDDAMTIHEIPFSWDRAYAITGQWRTANRAMFGYAHGEAYNISAARNNEPRLPYEAADVPEDHYPDALNAAEAVRKLKVLSEAEQPFFLAVGFYRPHLPFNAPQRFWDLYDRDEIPRPAWETRPRNVTVNYTLHDSYEPTSHYHWPSGRGNINEEEARLLRHAYAAATTYVDAQIGKVLDAYRELGLEKNTIVVLWSDHGWHVGEHGIFGKWTNHEWSVRAPMMIRTPNMPHPGVPSMGVVETIDIYPTLAALCGLTPPDDVEGVDLTPLLLNPYHPGKTGAISMVPRGQNNHGYTLRTDRYRLVRWANPQTDELLYVELYDHVEDPNETINIAEEHPDVVEKLLNQLATMRTELIEP